MKKALRESDLDSTNSKNRKTGKILLSCLFVIALFVLETLFLGSITKVEGVKIGLYNAIIVFVIMNSKLKIGYLLAGVKIATGMFVTSNILFYSLMGGLISVTAMVVVKRALKEKVGYLGISIAGALMYNITAYLTAAISLQNWAVFYNLPSVLLLSVIYGGLTGSIGYIFAKSRIIQLVERSTK